ncbi:hypothetical protein SELMODRAFT_413123 [Selaginella moellendorffii]|uniref:Uncharacterized protein n=1 Tax=Selaginella moellendorffii TaxID=88036 RepID=D8RNF4_SELML|nr:hypothetical protein SELMODRAFT_413123 [Selaginella moellendorffii]
MISALVSLLLEGMIWCSAYGLVGALALCPHMCYPALSARSALIAALAAGQRSQVRRFPWLGANAAAPSRPAPVKPDFFDDDDEEEEEEDQRQRRKAGELDWATRARELVIQDMSFRKFTDEDFQGLLPPHLRISKKKAKKKKKKKTRAKEEGAEAALQLEESRSAIKTKKKKDKDDDASSNLQAPLRERYMNIEQSYSDSEGDEGEEELTTELTVDLVDSRDVEEVLETIERVKGRFRLSSINVATALHRIAKHMVTLSMSETRRLKYARQCDVAELVAWNATHRASPTLPISKIGGHLLYRGEMEIIARAALAKVDEFNPRTLPELLLPCSTARPHSLRSSWTLRAEFPRSFEHRNWPSFFGRSGAWLGLWILSWTHRLFSKNKLWSIVWSYAVLGQLQGPFFAHVCKEIRAFEQLGQHKHMLQLTQLYQVVLALKREGKDLQLGRIEKRAPGSRILRAEDFKILPRIPEYVDADYSLDFAMKGGKWENLQGESEHVDFLHKLLAPHIRQIEQEISHTRKAKKAWTGIPWGITGTSAELDELGKESEKTTAAATTPRIFMLENNLPSGSKVLVLLLHVLIPYLVRRSIWRVRYCVELTDLLSMACILL